MVAKYCKHFDVQDKQTRSKYLRALNIHSIYRKALNYSHSLMLGNFQKREINRPQIFILHRLNLMLAVGKNKIKL